MMCVALFALSYPTENAMRTLGEKRGLVSFREGFNALSIGWQQIEWQKVYYAGG
jgi:hypothetical protein